MIRTGDLNLKISGIAHDHNTPYLKKDRNKNGERGHQSEKKTKVLSKTYHSRLFLFAQQTMPRSSSFEHDFNTTSSTLQHETTPFALPREQAKRTVIV